MPFKSNTVKELIIIGSRGFGREVFSLATKCKEFNKEFKIKGFLDDMDVQHSKQKYPPILSSVEKYSIKNNDVFICALGDVKWKKYYINLIKNKDGQFINLIHPTAEIDKTAKLGSGLIIMNGVVIKNECLIKDFSTVQPYSVMGHDSSVGNYCHLNSYSFLGGYAKLEDEVTLHTRATILPKMKVGKGATVGVNSSVIKNIRPGITVFGNPAIKIG